MKIDRLFAAAAIAMAGAWSIGADAQTAIGDATIHLHMPGQSIHLHPIRRHSAKSAVRPEEGGAEPAAGKSTPTAPQENPSARAKGAGAASERPAIPFNFGDEESPSPSGRAKARSDSQAMHTAALPPHVRPSSHVAAGQAAGAGLIKHGAVLFSKGAPYPSPAQLDGVKILAGDLSTALESGGARVELDAYGGAPGDKSSDARRLSLRRALAIRQLLIDDGVPSSRIDVRAMGGVDDKGPSDRVDVFVRAG